MLLVPQTVAMETASPYGRLLDFKFLANHVFVIFPNFSERIFFAPPHFSFFSPSSPVHPSHPHLVMVIRLQVPRLALRRRLNALGGSVSRPTPWRRRPIAFLCYILSASALRPLANRVRAAFSWLDSGKEGRGR